LFVAFELITDYQHYITYALEPGSLLYGRNKVSVDWWIIDT